MDVSGIQRHSASDHDAASSKSLDKDAAQVAVGDLRDEEVLAALQNYTPGSDEEKRFVRKVDMILLPVLWWMYILAYLDRGNIVSIRSS